MTQYQSKSELTLLTKYETEVSGIIDPWERHWKDIHGKPYERSTDDVRECLVLAVSRAVPHYITTNMRKAIQSGCERLRVFLWHPERTDWRTESEIKSGDGKTEMSDEARLRSEEKFRVAKLKWERDHPGENYEEHNIKKMKELTKGIGRKI